jgi:hypothetical protein
MTVSRKYNKIWMGLAALLTVAGCFFSSCAVAAEKEITLDGEIYSSKQIIEDFIRSAFPAVQDRGALQKNSGGIYKKHYEGSYVESRIEWIKDLKDAQHPKQVLHKYMQKEIKVGFGWPPLQETGTDYERFHDKYKIVKAQLENMIPLLERATERHIVIIDRERETVKDYATVRIIFFENFFKDNRFKPDPHGGASPLNDETTARFVVKTLPHVDFTPSSRTGVGGYFLTDGDSQIMLSVCEIWPYFRHGLDPVW